MKKLLLILLCVPLIGFGQTKDQELFNDALKYENSENFELSIEYFTKSIKSSNNKEIITKSYNGRGRCYRKLMQYFQAEIEYLAAIEYNPTHKDAYANLSWLYAYYLDQYELAISIANQGMVYDPEMWNLYFNRGYACIKLEKYKLAVLSYDACIMYYKGNPANSYNLRGVAKLFSRSSSSRNDYCDDFKKSCDLGSIGSENGCKNYKNIVCKIEGVCNPDTAYIYIEWDKELPPKYFSTLRDTIDWKIKYKTCPVCKKKDKVIPITYGLPGKELMELSKSGEVILAGCVISTNSPRWYCKRDLNKF